MLPRYLVFQLSSGAPDSSERSEPWHPHKYHDAPSRGGIRSTEIIWDTVMFFQVAVDIKCAFFPIFAGHVVSFNSLRLLYVQRAKTLFPIQPSCSFKFMVKTHCDSELPRLQDNMDCSLGN